MKKLIIIATIITFGACSTETIDLVPGKGTLKGKVRTTNQAYNAYIPGQGVTVGLEGTNPILKTTTDADGNFEFKDLPMGTYNILYSKVGYGTHKVLGFSFVGGEEPTEVFSYIFKVPDVVVENIEYGIYSYSYDRWALSLNIIMEEASDDQPRTRGYFRYFLSNRPTVSPKNYVETGIVGSLYSGTFNTVRGDIIVYQSKFPKGSDLYFVVYPVGDAESSYTDLDTGKEIYSSISSKGSQVYRYPLPNNQ